MDWLRTRMQEPSSLAGMALAFQGISQLIATKGADGTAWGNLLGGLGAVFLPEKTAS